MIVWNFVQDNKHVSNKDLFSTKEVTPTNEMNADDLRIQSTDPNENNEYFDYDGIRLEGDEVSATLCIVY